MWELPPLLFCFFKVSLSGQCNLALENLALGQQLAILKRTQKRPAIGTKDRLFWIWLSVSFRPIGLTACLMRQACSPKAHPGPETE
jgi:hypothetical protein